MRVLLIGGTGFIGPFVASELGRLGHEVVLFHRHPRGQHNEIVGDRKRLSQSLADFRAAAPDVVIDLILSSGTQAREMMKVFRGVARRVVALSSMDVYRACGVLHRSEPGPLEPLPLTEDSPVRTKLQTYPPAQIAMLQQVFGWLDEEYDKIPVERVILGDNDLPGTVLRLPMVYGPGDPLRRFQPIVKRVDDGRQTMIFSDQLAQWRGTKGYVGNVAAAIALVATSDRAARRVYNVGEPDTLTELEWANEIARAAGWSGEFVVLPDDRAPAHLRAPGNSAQHWVADTRRIRDELGYREPVSRQEAIRRTIEWDRANPPTGFTPHQFDYDAEDAAASQTDAARAHRT